MGKTDKEKFELPTRVFFYTMDQIADMLMLPLSSIEKVAHFDGRTPGPRPRDKMTAKNVAAAGETPEWRIEEKEFIRWMMVKRLIPIRRY